MTQRKEKRQQDDADDATLKHLKHRWCCSVLQRRNVAVLYSVLQCRSVMQRVAVCGSIMQYIGTICKRCDSQTQGLQRDGSELQCVAVCCSVSQCVAVCRSVLNEFVGISSASNTGGAVCCKVKVCCSMLQYVAVRCNYWMNMRLSSTSNTGANSTNPTQSIMTARPQHLGARKAAPELCDRSINIYIHVCTHVYIHICIHTRSIYMCNV